MTELRARSTRRAVRFDSLEQEVFLNVWRTYDRLRLLEDGLFARFELTPQQYNVLRLLRAAAPAALPTLSLANKLVSRAPDITRMLDRLEQQGLIARHRPEENRRVVQVTLTATGTRLLDEIAGPLHQLHIQQLGHMSAVDLRQLCALLQQARGPHEDDASPWR